MASAYPEEANYSIENRHGCGCKMKTLLFCQYRCTEYQSTYIECLFCMPVLSLLIAIQSRHSCSCGPHILNQGN